MQLIDIVPNSVGKISDQQAQALIATREIQVRAYMLDHLRQSEADQFLDTMELLNQMTDWFEGLISLSCVADGFAKYCVENGKAEAVVIAEQILRITAPFVLFKGKPLDTTPFIEAYTRLPHSDLRHGETSILYQRVLNLSNLYTLLVRLCNRLSAEVMNDFEGAAKELAKTVYQMTEKVRYGRSN